MLKHKSFLFFKQFLHYVGVCLFLLLFIPDGTSQTSNPAHCGSGLSDPRGAPEGPGVYDGLGTYVSAYSLSLPSQGVCDCNTLGAPTSYFEIYFEDCIFQTGKGFDDPILGTERQLVMCRVFREISSFIIPNINPCSGNTGVVNIQIRRSDIDNQSLPNDIGGRASAYYLNEKKGINDGLPWILINSGEEPLGYSNSYHGFVQINFSPNSNFDWYSGENPIPSGSTQHDLYSECMHQALHVLGFATYINPNGTGNYLGSAVGGYTRWDTHLQLTNDVNGNLPNGTPVVINNPSPGLNWVMNTPPIDIPDDLFGSCNDPLPNGPDMVFNTNGSNYPVFTGQTANSLAFSHLSANCDGAPTPSYIMHPELEPGVRLSITSAEYDILCAIGYHLTPAVAGSSSNCDCAVGAVDDGKKGCNGSVFTVPICGTLTIEPSDILANDPNATGVQFIEVVDLFSGNVIASGSDYIFTPSKLGLIALEYVPIGCNGKTGNKAFIFINVVNGPGCLTTCDNATIGCAPPLAFPFCATVACTPPANPCNLICNPGICATVMSDEEGTSSAELSPIDPMPPLVDLPDWIRTRQDPDLFVGGGDGTIRLRGGGPFGNKYWAEGVMTFVPVSGGTKYLYSINFLRLDGFSASNQNHIISQLLQGDLLQPQYNPTQPIPPIYTGTTPQVINDQVMMTKNLNVRAGSCFETGNSGHNALEVFISDAGDYINVFMDDVELVEDDFTAGIDVSTTCNTPVNLGQPFCMLSNVEIEYVWKEKISNVEIARYKVLNGNVVTFSGSTFNAATQQVAVTVLQTTAYILERIITNYGGLGQDFTLCSTADEVTVFVPVLPADASFNFTQTTCDSYNFSAVVQGAGITHSWNFDDPASGASNTSADANPSHTFSQNGVFVVSHTITNECGAVETITQEFVANCVDFSCPCTTTNLYNIDASESSPFYNPVLGGTLYSDLEAEFNYDKNNDGILGYNEHHGCIAIKGRLIVDQSLKIEGANVQMQPCAEIFINRVNASAFPTFQSEFNNFYGCVQMWKGITVGDQCRLEMNEGNIQDAEFAVRAPGSSPLAPTPTSVSIEDVAFVKNHVGMYLGESGQKRRVTHLPFENLTFIGAVNGQYLLPPCTSGLANYNAGKGYAGIVAQGLSSLNVGLTTGAGYSNGFKDIRNGIIAENTATYVYHSSFDNIPGIGGVFPAGLLPSFAFSTGIGIATVGRSATVQYCKFSACGHALYGVNNTNLHIQNNKIKNVFTGIQTFGAKGFSILDNKEMTFERSAVIARELSTWQSSKYQIARNDGEFEWYPGSSPNPTGSVSHPIVEIKNANPLFISGYPRISFNTFKNFYLGRSGINIQGTGGWTIDDNMLSDISSAAQTQGVLLENSNFNYLYHNTVKNSSCPGFRVKGSTDNTFCCNIAENTKGGVNFLGVCSKTSLRNTEFIGNHQNSVECGPGTFISTQYDKGNKFEEFSGTAVHLGNDNEIENSQFKVLNNQVPNYPPNISAPNQSIFAPWFVLEGYKPICGFNPDLDPNHPLNKECKAPDPVPPTIRISPDETDRAIADGDFYTNEYGDMQQWEGGRRLYDLLKDQPDLLTNDALFSDFYSDTEEGVIGMFYEAEKSIRSLPAIPSDVASALDNHEANVQALTNALEADWESLSLASTFADSVQLLTSINANLSERDEELDAIANILNDLAQLQNTKIQSARLLVEALPSQDVLTQNRKAIDLVYLETLAAGITELTPQQLNTISAIAHQCVLEGGNAVLDARTLYQLHEEKIFSDDSLCFAVEQRKMVSQTRFLQKQSILVAPNPANEILHIKDLSGKLNGVLTVNLLDINGKQVLRTEFSGPEIDLSINGLQNGVYICRIENANGLIDAQKVVIIH